MPGIAVTSTSGGTPATAADRAVERRLREPLAAAAPTDAPLGEELGRIGESGRLWIPDPIDGTAFFAHHDVDRRIHVALEVAGETEPGCAAAPST